MSKIIIKTPEQIDGIRKSSQLAGSSLKFISDYVKEGVNTLYLDKLIEEYIRDNAAIPACLNYLGFPKSCCISLNDVICHGIPNEKTVLREGDILNIDVTTILDGYFGDSPNSNLFEGANTEDGQDGWRSYLVCVIEDVYNQINGYGHAYNPTTNKELSDLTKLIPEIF